VTDISYDLNDLVTEVLRDNNNLDMPNTRHKVKVAYNILDIVTAVEKYYAANHASKRTWTYDYDKEDRLTLTTLPVSSRKIKSTYDARGLEVTRTTAPGTADAKDVIFAYDKNHRLVTSKDGLLNTTTYSYDQFDRLVTVTDPAAHYRTLDYDKNSNVLTRTAFSSGGGSTYLKTALEYNKDNELTKSREMAKKSNL
jgi:YD repeat-containing protein